MLYDHPDNLFVAAFIGSPAMNLYEASVSPEADQVRIGPQSLALSEHLLAARPALRGYRDRKVVVGVRPEDLHDAALEPAPAPASTLLADVELIEALGNELQVHFLVEATRARSQDTAAATETAELEGASASPRGGSLRGRGEGVAPLHAEGGLQGDLRGRHRQAALLRPRGRVGRSGTDGRTATPPALASRRRCTTPSPFLDQAFAGLGLCVLLCLLGRTLLFDRPTGLPCTARWGCFVRHASSL